MKCYAYDNADKRRRDRRFALKETYNRKHGIVEQDYQEPLPTLPLNRKPTNRVDMAVLVNRTKYYDSISNCCLPECALLSVQSKKVSKITARS